MKSSTGGVHRGKEVQTPGYTTRVGKIPEAEAETEYPGIQEEKRDQVACEIRKKGAGGEGRQA